MSSHLSPRRNPACITMSSNRLTIRDVGYTPGVFPPGPTNSILDVPGVHISQATVPTSSNLEPGSTATKGVTVISPRPPSEFYKPCAASKFTFNGNGELTATHQIADWGFTNTPIALTNSLSLGTVFDGIWDWVLDQEDKFQWDDLTRARHYGTPVVAETADWIVNSKVRHSRLEKEVIKRCFEGLKAREDGGEVEEGQRGGGAGMTCHQFAAGTGTASRVLGGGEGSTGEYTIGVLCQSNYGLLQDMVIGGVPIGRILKEKEPQGSVSRNQGNVDVHAPEKQSEVETGGRTQDGSIVIIIITDAPFAAHQLNRIARHATAGLAQVGSRGIGKNHSGDIFLALSNADFGPQVLEGTKLRLYGPTQTFKTELVKNESIDTYFYACHEAVEEAILNSIVGGREGTVGMDGTKVDGFPVEKVKALLEKHLVQV